jgi:integrase
VSIWIDKQGRRHVGLMVGGQRVHRILPKDATARDAKRIEGQLRESLESLKAINIPGNPLISEVMSLYMTHSKNLRSPKTAEYHAKRAGPWAEKYRANQARAFAAHLVQDMLPEYQPATINRTIGTVKKALHMAWELGRTPEDYSKHIKRLPENNARDTYLTIEQVRKIAQHASEQTRAAIWIAILTGARRGEILAIGKEDIGADAITIRAANTKTLRTRTVPVTEALKPWLKYVPLQVNYEGLKTGFRRAREAAGMPEVRFHDLRHSCASLLVNMGQPLEVIRDILGHTTVKTTERYAHLRTSAQREALEKLGSAITLAITPPKKKRPRKAALSLVGGTGIEPVTPAV